MQHNIKLSIFVDAHFYHRGPFGAYAIVQTLADASLFPLVV